MGKKLYFDHLNCNYFTEDLNECIVTVTDVTGQQLNNYEDL